MTRTAFVAGALLCAAISAAEADSSNYLQNDSDIYSIEVRDNGQLVCSLAPNEYCWWDMADGAHSIDILRSDGREIHDDLTAPDRILHEVIEDEYFQWE